ncbi:DUF5819 family protein [Microbacterium stercoris]|uniref:Uncharacterized protein n=1 Tax=Microbacterium stercoris TaxID=2820289 RepID=A0A939TV88_9MICO|nr:DUF5819 family protein [Microbacterium stercoris]MBO3664844.1 hypothetical protein [Microbacterium stercoris]
MPKQSISRKTLVLRASVAVSLLAATWHIFASFLWISPPTPLRELVPGDVLQSYMLPWYGQSWSVFAPEPINGDYALNVRALVPDENGEMVETEWVNATAVEQSWATHNLFPPRAAGLSVRQASSFSNAWKALTAEQQQTAALNYFKGDNWLGRMRDAMLADEEGDDDAVIEYIVQERYTDAYATQVAHALWGEDVQRVQYEITRQNVIPFAERNNPDAKRPEIQRTSVGWRGLIVMPGQDEKAFPEVFAPAHADFVAEEK